MEVESQYGEQVTFIGVPGLADEPAMLEFHEETGIDTFPNVPDGDGEIWQAFGVTEQRTYVLLNDDGTFERTGYGNLEEDVQALIAK